MEQSRKFRNFGCRDCLFREKDENGLAEIRCLRFPPQMVPITKFNVVTGKPDLVWVRVYSSNPPDFICGEHPNFHTRYIPASSPSLKEKSQ